MVGRAADAEEDARVLVDEVDAGLLAGAESAVERVAAADDAAFSQMRRLPRSASWPTNGLRVADEASVARADGAMGVGDAVDVRAAGVLLLARVAAGLVEARLLRAPVAVVVAVLDAAGLPTAAPRACTGPPARRATTKYCKYCNPRPCRHHFTFSVD